jgi:hypothetical protein
MKVKILPFLLLLIYCLEFPAVGIMPWQANHPSGNQPAPVEISLSRVQENSQGRLVGNLLLSPNESLQALSPRAYLPVVHSFLVQEIQPVFIFPVNGELLDFSSTWVFQVQPIPNATGFLWGFEQNDILVWENYRNEGALSGATYTILEGSYAHSLFTTGALKVWVRALIYNEWTDLTIVNIFLI